MSVRVRRYHDISCGHRVLGHEGKCAHLHGHNYRIHFTCEAPGPGVDPLGRVIDFSEIKRRLCMWLEDNWDHRTLIYVKDSWVKLLSDIDQEIVVVPFNPTAENMAMHLVEHVGPMQLDGTGIRLVECTVEETRKCSASYTLESSEA